MFPKNSNTGSFDSASAATGTRNDNGSGVINLNAAGVIYDMFTIPTSLTFSSSSASGGSAATITQYIFNDTVMSPLVTDNGSGANSVTNTYGDGYSGRIYTQLLRSAKNAKGVRIKGFTLQITTASTGAQNASALNTMQMQILYANGQGGATPVPINVSEALRNVQQQVGIFTVVKEFYLNAVSQISYSNPVNTAFNFIFVTETGSL